MLKRREHAMTVLGLTSPPHMLLLLLLLQVDKGTPVAICAEEKEHAMAVGLTSPPRMLPPLLPQVDKGTPVAVYAEKKRACHDSTGSDLTTSHVAAAAG
jgi:hypothetical protein